MKINLLLAPFEPVLIDFALASLSPWLLCGSVNGSLSLTERPTKYGNAKNEESSFMMNNDETRSRQ